MVGQMQQNQCTTYFFIYLCDSSPWYIEVKVEHYMYLLFWVQLFWNTISNLRDKNL